VLSRAALWAAHIGAFSQCQLLELRGGGALRTCIRSSELLSSGALLDGFSHCRFESPEHDQRIGAMLLRADANPLNCCLALRIGQPQHFAVGRSTSGGSDRMRTCKFAASALPGVCDLVE
jgi:hypothetical protein